MGFGVVFVAVAKTTTADSRRSAHWDRASFRRRDSLRHDVGNFLELQGAFEGDG